MLNSRILILGAGAALGLAISEALIGSMAQMVTVEETLSSFDESYFWFVDSLTWYFDLFNSKSSLGPSLRPISILTPGTGIEHAVKDHVSSPFISDL